MSDKILIVLTNQSVYPETGKRTGLWFSELVHFYDFFAKRGYEQTLMSPKGGIVPLDPSSLAPRALDRLSRSYYKNREFMLRLEMTLSGDGVNASDFRAVYFTGGHGTMFDFANNKKLQDISLKIYESGGIVSAVCHGPAALLNVKSNDGTYLISGKQITGFSNFEEFIIVNTVTKERMPFLLEKELRDRGAVYKRSFFPFTPKVVMDGRIITGENPASARPLARKVHKALRNP